MRAYATLVMIVAATLAAACIPDDPVTPSTGPAGKSASDVSPSAVGQPAGDGGADDADTKALLAEVESMRDQLKDRPRDFNVNVALGNLFYNNGKYIDAIEYFTDALAIGAPVERELSDPAARRSAPAAQVPAGCALDRPTPEDIARGGHMQAFERVVDFAADLRATDPAGARACMAQLVPVLADVHAKRGNSWYLVGNVDKARADHSAALGLDPDNPEALFFAGAIALETAHGDPAKLEAGKAFWKKLLQVAPNHARAELVRETLPRVDELFGPKPAAGGPMMAGGADGSGGGASAPMLPAGFAEQMQNTKHTPEMDAQLDKTTDDGEALLKQQKWQEALDTFKQVMPLRPSGRIALDMGIALRELGKPTAERVLTMATQMPGGDPTRARYELAVYYEKRDPQQAKALYEQIADDPKVGADAKARLAQLK